jgi:hypothetical protein
MQLTQLHTRQPLALPSVASTQRQCAVHMLLLSLLLRWRLLVVVMAQSEPAVA